MDTDVLVVGFGPGGAALSALLASRGVRALAIERQRDFGRVFRGEGLQPGGMAALQQMGLGAGLATVPQSRIDRVRLYNGRMSAWMQMPRDPAKRTLLISQPGLLELLAAEAERHAGFSLLRGAVFQDLLWERGRVAGARARVDGEEVEIRARLVVAADGRGSLVCRRAGLSRTALEQGFDVLWFRTELGDFLPDRTSGHIEAGPGRAVLVYPSPDGGHQLGLVVRKDETTGLSQSDRLTWAAQQLSPGLGAALLGSAEQVTGSTRLSVICERLPRWSVPGLLLLGDAAHPMSPVGAQGVNMALRDAVVAANHLVPALRAGAGLDALDAAAVATWTEREAEVAPVQALQTRSGARMLSPSPLLLWAVPWLARLGLPFRQSRDRARMGRGLVPLTLTV